MTKPIFLAIVQIFGMFGVGWVARHFRYIDERDISRWGRFAFDFLFPGLVFHSIVRDFEVERLREFWPLPLIGFGMMVLGAAAGYLLRLGVRGKPEKLVHTFHHFCAINNYGFLPIIIVTNLWGVKVLPQLFCLTLGSTVGYWTIGVGLLSGGSVRDGLKQILSPTLVVLTAALAICLMGWREAVPDVLLNIAGAVGGAAVPCLLILVGAGLYPMPRMTNRGTLVYLTALRLLLLPAAIVGILRCLPLSDDVHNIAMVVALMPVSVSSTILARRYNGDPEFAAQAAIVTTLVSLITVPLGLSLLLV